MKKEYVTPALETIKFDITDIITLSNATSGGPGYNKPTPGRVPGANSASVTMTQDKEMIVNY